MVLVHALHRPIVRHTVMIILLSRWAISTASSTVATSDVRLGWLHNHHLFVLLVQGTPQPGSKPCRLVWAFCGTWLRSRLFTAHLIQRRCHPLSPSTHPRLATRVGTVFSVSLRCHTRSPQGPSHHLRARNNLHHHLFHPFRSPTAQSLKPSLPSLPPAPCSHTLPTAL